MKLLRPALFLFLCLLFLPWPSSADESRIETPFIHEEKSAALFPEKKSLRIATWNIEWFPAGMRKSAKENVQWQIAAVAALIKEFNPDILITQETRNLGALISLN